MPLPDGKNYYAKTIYSFCLLSIFGAHLMFWLSVEKKNYSMSILMLFLLLSLYFILLFSLKVEADKNAESYLYKFLQISAITDYKRVQERQIDRLIDSVIECTNSNRIYFLVRNGCIIPCTVMLLEIIAILTVANPTVLLLFLFCSSVAVAFIVLISFVIGIKNNVAQISVYNFSHTLINCARGIKLYDAYSFAKKKIEEMMSGSVMNIAGKYKRIILRSLLVYLFLSLVIVSLLIYGQDVLKQIHGHYGLFTTGIVLISIIFVSWFCVKGGNKLVDFQKALENKMIYIDQTSYDDATQIEEMFITFNNVTLFDKDGTAVINNLSISIDDRDFVIVVGEGSIHAQYIYDLIFRNYECNDGLIYIGGLRSTSLPVSVIAASIGYFDENFCLIFGTVLDNISMGSDGYENVYMAAEAACLYEDELNISIFDSEGNIAINQCLKLKIQIARIILRKYKTIIVNTPSHYEDKENEALFYNFVKSIMQYKTVILSTSNLNFIMYSNKVLYFGKNSYCFGPHSEILYNYDYMNFLKMSDYDICTSIDTNADKLI